MREEIEARPGVVLFIGLILGLVAIQHLPVLVFLLLGLIGIRPVVLKCCLGGAFLVGLLLAPPVVVPLRSAVAIHEVGTVASVPVLYRESESFEVRVPQGLILAIAPYGARAMLADRVRLDGVLMPTPAIKGTWAPMEGIQGRVDLDSVTIEGEGSLIAHLADSWRRSFMAFLGRNLQPKDAALADAVCFNARAMLGPSDREEMAQAGILHFASASGLQVFVLGALLAMGLRFLPVSRSVQILLLAVLLTVYALAAGLQPQIVRAAMMTVLGLSAYLFRREPDALSALALAGLGYLLWHPQSVYEMAFQLSTVTVACFVLFFQRSREKPAGWKQELVRDLYDFLKLSGILVMATAPMIAYYMGTISLVSVISNLALSWSMPLIVALAFVSYGFSFAIPPLGDAVASNVLSPLCHWTYGMVNWLGDGGGLSVPGFSPWWLLVYYGAWLMTYRRRVVQP